METRNLQQLNSTSIGRRLADGSQPLPVRALNFQQMASSHPSVSSHAGTERFNTLCSIEIHRTNCLLYNTEVSSQTRLVQANMSMHLLKEYSMSIRFTPSAHSNNHGVQAREARVLVVISCRPISVATARRQALLKH